MKRYILQLRRGVKEVDDNGNIVRDDWANYEARDDHEKPLDGELVLEFYNGIPRLKIGDGVREFSALPYMSVDSFTMPTSASITLSPDAWVSVLDAATGTPMRDRYYQIVEVQNATITPNSKVDLQPNPTQLAIFSEKDITFTTVNRGGEVKVYVVGQKPTQEYTIQATVTEVAEDA